MNLDGSVGKFGLGGKWYGAMRDVLGRGAGGAAVTVRFQAGDTAQRTTLTHPPAPGARGPPAHGA